jgi:hypothetical protein
MPVALRKLGVCAGTIASAFALSSCAFAMVFIQYSGPQVAGTAKGGLPISATGAAIVATVVGDGGVNVLV